MKTLTQEEKIQSAVDKDNFDYERRLKLVGETSKHIEKQMQKLKNSQIMLDESKRKRTNMILFRKKLAAQTMKEEILPSHRQDWMERYKLAMNAPETTEEEVSHTHTNTHTHTHSHTQNKNSAQSVAKYHELSAVSHDFIATATKTATIIIDEMNFPVHEKSIRPVEEKEVDGRAYEAGRGDKGFRHKFEANGIRFKIMTDDHGLFNGSDEFCAKSGGNDCMCSLEFNKCHLDDVVIPFQATIDYSGFRVLAVAKLPILVTEFNEAGDIKRTRTEVSERSERVLWKTRIHYARLAPIL